MASSDEVQQSASSNSSSDTSGFSETHSPSDQQSRYINEFHELCTLGKGGCGAVMKVLNKTDQQVYAVKMIELWHPVDHVDNESLIREAELLATLNHPNIVRYHASWIEMWSKKGSGNAEVVSGSSKEECVEKIIENFDSLNLKSKSSKSNNLSKKSDAIHASTTIPYLFIQMELCSGTLRSILDSPNHLEHERAAHLFYGIIQGLKYVHEKGLSHRDLNPNNIFLDEVGSPKIGDFGLARLTRKIQQDREDQVSSLSLSKDVGTPFYKAPEITLKLKYDNRVDLYSLGIILVEMLYPLKTGMERRKVLEDLRRLEFSFPDDFLQFASEWQKNIAESLLSHSADKRPSLDEILAQLGEQYPFLENVNLEEAMHPSSNSFKKVVHAVFNQKHEERDVTYGASKPNHGESRTQVSIVRLIENVFRKHGAIHVSTPLLCPTGQKKDSTEVQLLTRDGLVVHLPHNAKVNFARYIVLNDCLNGCLYRYDTLQTYEEHGGRSHPRIRYECVFDIISTDPVNLCADAHVLYVLLAVFNEIPVEDNTSNYLAVSHTDLVKAILLSVGVREQHLSIALQLVGKNGFEDGLKKLKSDQIKESGLDVEKLERIICLSGTPDDVKVHMLKEIDVDCKKGVELAIDSIKEILLYHHNTICYARNVNVALEVNMRWCNNVHFYSGIILTGLRRHTDKRDDIIISDGGRFDDILSSLQAELMKEKPEIARKRCYGCGISVFPSKIVEFQQDFWPPELVVLTCRPNQDLEKEMYDLAQKLRLLGFNCREELNAEILIIEAYKQDENILCVVELLPSGEINLTHKFTSLNPSTNTVSVGQLFNPHPPTLKIRKDDVYNYFSMTLNDVAMINYMMPGCQMII